jgi:GAF domain-containing protein/anti-sigma regulatory factor (Ser/Thr protein kinase)
MPSEVLTGAGDQVVEALRRELAEAREQQAATAGILGVISNSPTDLQRAFTEIAVTAARFCDAYDAVIFQVEGDLLRLVAHHGPISTPSTFALTREVSVGRAILDGRTIHVADLQAETDEYPEGSDRARRLGVRAVLNVPLINAGKTIGVIGIRRTEARLFSERQIGLLQTFANQAGIAIENARLFEEVQQKNGALTEANTQLIEALEQQTATSEVLSIISRSPTDTQPVFDTIARNAARLCEAKYCFVYRFDGQLLYFVAHDGVNREGVEAARRAFPMQPSAGSIAGRAVLSCEVAQIPDVEADPDFALGVIARAAGYRSGLAVPMVRNGVPIGAIGLGRSQLGFIPARQIELLKTFADQAVIAIENARLFEEVQARTRALQESLEYQTAMSDVLGVISSSPDKLQPVLDAIVNTAKRLCIADRAYFNVLQAGRYHSVAATEGIPKHIIDDVRAKPELPGRGSHAARAVLEKRPIHIKDTRLDPEFTLYDVNEPGRARTLLGVPLLRRDEVIGVITLARIDPAPFTQRQIDLVATFANQAVIAINNVDLFEEVQVRTRQLQEALEYQTATSDVLKVISRSKFDLQPVLDTIAEGAARLCGGLMGGVFRYDGELMHLGAMMNFAPGGEQTWRSVYPRPATHDTATGRAILEKTVVIVPDVEADARAEWAREVARTGGYRSAMAVPMLREGLPIGAIMVARVEPGSFAEAHVELLKTFADQAVIAIDNTQLFEQVQARNRDLTALGEVGRAVSSTLDLKAVLKSIVDRAVELSGTDAGSIFYFREELSRFELGETSGLQEEVVAKFLKLDIVTGQTGLGEAIANRQPLQVPDVIKRPSNPLRDAALEAGLHAALIVPLLGSEGALGALVLQRRRIGEFSPSVVSLMQSFADQSAIALENARLFEQIAQKSRELEIASQHKSQFVANMSHELRTPLAAILGYAELMQEGFYEPQGQKSLDALTRIRANGKHLLGLINTVLDIAKIESGQFTLNMAEYALDSVVETVRSATESLAQNKKLALKTEVAKSLPIGLGDEQRLTQVLLNLVGNAIKFTDIGEVRVIAMAVNGHFSVSVADTGPGIPEQEQKRIFEQFHQIDSSLTKAKGGTGLGLAIAKQIVEMHGGRIWVESTPGKGATFQLELPTRAELRKRAP